MWGEGSPALSTKDPMNQRPQGLVNSLQKETQVLLGVESALVAVELLTNIVVELCPYSTDGVQLLSLGLCA